MLIKKERTWVLVADGAHAQTFQYKGLANGLDLIFEAESEEGRQPTRELGTERPGRQQGTQGVARHGLAPKADWHQQAEEQFVCSIADRINAAALKDRFDRLVLVAPPRTLGSLRCALNTAAKDRLKQELNKDLTGLTRPQLVERLKKDLTP